MSEETGYLDKDGKTISLKDLLYNPFVGDLWIVERGKEEYVANLIPNSGMIRHGDNATYPVHTELLGGVHNEFKRIEVSQLTEKVQQLVSQYLAAGGGQDEAD